MDLIDPLRAIGNVLDRCLGVQAGEEVVLLVDHRSAADVVAGLRRALDERNCTTTVVEVPLAELPGQEVPRPAAHAIRHSAATIELTSLFLGSNQARRAATAAGSRYLAMPGVRLDTFRPGGPLDVDFDDLRSGAEAVGDLWTSARSFTLTTPAGTHLTGSIVDRPGRVLHGICRGAGGYMAPPDIEAGTAPVEGTTNGIAVIDGDLLFMGQGPLREPVVLEFEEGRLIGVSGPERHRLLGMLERCDDERMTNLAEVSLGLNPAGHVCDVAMETESAYGTAHIALGNSLAYGGTVNAVAHLDCVMREASLQLDGQTVELERYIAPPPSDHDARLGHSAH